MTVNEWLRSATASVDCARSPNEGRQNQNQILSISMEAKYGDRKIRLKILHTCRWKDEETGDCNNHLLKTIYLVSHSTLSGLGIN